MWLSTLGDLCFEGWDNEVYLKESIETLRRAQLGCLTRREVEAGEEESARESANIGRMPAKESWYAGTPMSSQAILYLFIETLGALATVGSWYWGMAGIEKEEMIRS